MDAPGARGSGVVLPALLALVGFLAAVAFAQEQLREEHLPARAEQLEGLIRQRQAVIRDLANEVTSLSGRLADAQDAAIGGSEQTEALAEDLDRLREVTGIEPVRGPGVTVELADSPEAPATREETADLRIQDADLRLVVNALWAAGAEAVAVGERRVVSTTAIRAAGDAILVNLGAVSSPYLVTAIGDPQSLHRRLAESEIGRQFALWEQVYGLGYALRTGERLTVPGLDAGASLDYAAPTDG